MADASCWSSTPHSAHLPLTEGTGETHRSPTGRVGAWKTSGPTCAASGLSEARCGKAVPRPRGPDLWAWPRSRAAARRGAANAAYQRSRPGGEGRPPPRWQDNEVIVRPARVLHWD
ncbi:hypothetical protein NDU88_000079 [Pleurodeles waltl]|uniref:Uncharacterized protein n=1 Tax=Pleurodeles waltl TaxID=8319 RepID=A0AAV7V5V6_PLEWA|nr:hypothetical protein NDU88_000079 [Pleurodeles waltl]